MGRVKTRRRGTGSIFKRSNTWYIAYYVDGEQFKEKIGSAPLVTKGQAEQALKARLGEIVQGSSIEIGNKSGERKVLLKKGFSHF